LREAITLQLIASGCYGACLDELADMRRLQYCVFKQRIEWDVETGGSIEGDAFDAFGPMLSLVKSGRCDHWLRATTADARRTTHLRRK